MYTCDVVDPWYYMYKNKHWTDHSVKKSLLSHYSMYDDDDYDHRRTGPVSFRGAEVSCPNMLSHCLTENQVVFPE